MLSLSWSQIHGALTHFPVALLIGGVFFDFGTTFWKKTEWRVTSFWMLALAVAMSIPSLATGLFAGNEIYNSPDLPPVFVWHRALAFASSGLAWLLLFWRNKARDGETLPNENFANVAGNSTREISENSQTGLSAQRAKKSRRVRGAMLFVALLTAILVGVTGHFGGQMVFGDSSTSASFPDESGVKSAESSTRNPDFVALDANLVKQGAKIYVAEDCASCHKIDGVGGKKGPDLSRAGADEPSIEWQIAHLKKPRSKRPNSSMPAYDYLSDKDLKALATFMVSKR